MNTLPINNHFKNLVELNIAILCISSSGVLGRSIDLPVPTIIASRALLASLFIFIFCKLKKFDFKVKRKDRFAFIAGGVLMGLHWITYFYTLKLSSVSVGMLLLFTYTIITAFLEPILLKTKFQKIHLVLGIMVIIGVYFIVPDLGVEKNNVKVVVLGIASAICYSLRNIIMKSKSTEYNGSILMLYQLIIITICLTPFFFTLDTTGFINQLPSNLVLALLTTAIGHSYFLYSFKKFSTTTVSIISSTQPIYGIILAVVFLKEYPESSAILGGGLILFSVVIESFRGNINKKQTVNHKEQSS